MNKLKLFLPLIFIFMYSCSDILTETKSATETLSSTNPRMKIRGDNLYDMLGFGCDATGPYLDQMKTAYQVINIDSLAKNTNIVTYDNPTHTIVEITSGSDALTLSHKYDTKFASSLSIPIYGQTFTGGLNAEFVSSNTITSKYSYANANINVYVSHSSIKKFTDITILQKYLTSTFKNDLINKTPDQIVALYGTHVYTDIYTGGTVNCKYRSAINNTTKESSATYGANLAIGKVFSMSASTTGTTTSSSEYSSESMSYKSVGGSGTTIFGSWTPGSTTTVNINSWSSTVLKSNPLSLQLIQIGDSSLIAIYEFVADPVKKAALKTAVNNYILSKNITEEVALPFYRYVNLSGGNHHFYTTDLNEVINISNWKYEKIECYVLPTSSPDPNAVPLYRYYLKDNNDHFYTTDFSVLGNGKNSYSYDGIRCKVYKTQVPNSQPLYQYCNGSNHFYTTNWAELGNGSQGFKFEYIVCYVL